MNNIIKDRTTKEIINQLNRAEVKKNQLIKKIYKEYEIYFHIVRKSISTSAEEGILGLYSELSNSDKSLNLSDLNNFLKKNISLQIHSKIPLITIEQLKLEDDSYQSKQLINHNVVKELLGFRKNTIVNIEYEYNLTTKDDIEFNCNNDLNRYEYYDSHRKDKFTSINLDERYNLNSFSKDNILEKNHYKKEIDSFIELIEEINDNKLNEYENISYQESDDFIFSHNLKTFDTIDKSFSNLLSRISYSINSELFKLNLLKKFISEETFKSLSNDSYITKHPHPFVYRYDLNPENISINKNKYSDIYLFNINNVELEFNNINLSICRNNINELKNKFRLLNKKEKYWKNKEISLNNSN